MTRTRLTAGDAGHRYFFYGTLLDPDVQTTVIGRRLKPRDMTPAIIRNHRRVYVSGAWYPTLVPAEGVDVPGYLVRGLSPRERRWIDHFEDDDYVLTPVPVLSLRNGPTTASVYMPPHPGVASEKVWTLDEWRRRFKRRYIMRARRWMITDFDQNW